MSNWYDRASPRPIHPDNPVQVVILTCLVGILSYLAARGGGTLVLRPEMIWPVWPGCAFLVAVLLLTPRKIWPALVIAGLLGFVFYDLHEALPSRATVLLILADLIEILVAALGVSYIFAGVPRLNSVKSLAQYSLFAVILAPISVASAAANALEGDSWWIGFFTEALALLTLTPAILSWVEIVGTRFRASRARYLEAASMCIGLGIISYFTFIASDSQTRPAMLYSLVPFLLWSGLRFGVAGSSNSVAIVGFVAIWGTLHRRGPFTGNTPVHDVLSLQLFLLVAASSFMVLAAVVEQHSAAERARTESEERLRLAAKAGRMFAYSWDVASDTIVRSGEASEILGVDQATTATGKAISKMIHPDDKDRVEAALANVTPGHPGIQIEYRIIRPDRAVLFLERNSRAYFDDKGNLKRIVGMIVDRTESKQAEQALRESEQRFRLAAQAGRMYSFEWDVATGTVLRSSEHLKVFGVTQPLPLTHQQFVAKIHPDDRPNFLSTIAGLTPENPAAEITYRVMVADHRELAWLKSSGRAFFDGNGKMLRVIGMVADITSLKHAEEELSLMTRKLIEAQEQERARIAGELHDDINQRLAMLAVELEQLQNDPFLVQQRISELLKRTAEISRDVQALSHDLHSSKLEYLGVVGGIRSWCREFSERQDVKIDFNSDVHSVLPVEIGRTLFRVLQEALHNASKHSGVAVVEVQLWEAPDEIHMIVRDSGSGFDVEAASQGNGLGLISMRERVRLVKGTITIDSKPQRGTSIHVRLPIQSEQDSERAG